MDEKKRLLMASSSSYSSGAMEKKQEAIGAAVEQQQQQQKCPRCDSGNTKFCYYNNYSLSQPRHFCKACKRYWTRGGTLRNVPVGGGCRKNKRLKIISRPVPAVTTNNRVVNPIFSANNYPSTHHLGFSSAGQLLINGHDFLHNNINMVSLSSSTAGGGGGEVNYSSSCTSMTSLLASTMIQHQNFIISGGDVQLKDDFSSLKPLVSPLVQNGSGLAAAMNKVQGQMNYNYPVGNGNGNGGGWNNYLGYQNDGMEEQQVIGLSSSSTDPGSYYWSMSNANTATPSNNWHDPPANINNESSVPSLI